MITSLTNTRVKNIVQLRDRKRRKETGLTIVEGEREIAHALQAGVTFKEFYISRELLKMADVDDNPATRSRIVEGIVATSSGNAPVYETTKAVFSKMSYGDRAEGILAVCEPRSLLLEDLPSRRDPLFVIVESVEKPGNLGAILRTCDGAGVDGVIICNAQTDIYNPNVIRSSLGAIFSVNVVVSSNEEVLKYLRSKNIIICATLPRAKTVYTKEELTNALAVIVGSEQNGLTQFWVQHADLKVRIPMKGLADSLNVSASTAVLLYEIIRQRSE